MKKVLNISMLLLLLTGLCSCAALKKKFAKKDKKNHDALVLTDEGDMSEDTLADASSDSVSDDEEWEIQEDYASAEKDKPLLNHEEEEENDENKTMIASNPMSESEEVDANSDSSPMMDDSTGKMLTHKVEAGETLMMIAFAKYGDYRLWKKIALWNNLDSAHITKGMMLKYEKPEQDFVWQPNGRPYLVKVNDTLGKISKDKYNTYNRWREIYDNNKPLIRNPNLIFAGITIYYVPDRKPANR